MEYFIIAVVALLTSGLTLFSGFGVGTILLPVFAVFFPVEVAVAITAVVHLLNNLFKLVLLGKHAEWRTVFAFGVPAILTAFLGARMLLFITGFRPVATYALAQHRFEIVPVKMVVAALILIFALVEISGKLADLRIGRRWLPVGGMLSGFFGGLSGHQGALRSAFLLKAGLAKQQFIATGVVISCLVDVTRLFVYSSRFAIELDHHQALLVLTAVIAAFAGVMFGNRILEKVTMRTVRTIVILMLMGIAVGLGCGLI